LRLYGITHRNLLNALVDDTPILRLIYFKR
jgi:hypothetical protein